MAIYLGAALPLRSSHLPGETGPVVFPSTVLLRIEFTAAHCRQSAGRSLTPPFHPYRAKARRYISVALVLMSPSAGVTRYSCPVEPGLSSRTAFRLVPAAIERTRSYPCQSGGYSSMFSQLCQTFCTSSLSSNTSSIFCMFFRSPSLVRSI